MNINKILSRLLGTSKGFDKYAHLYETSLYDFKNKFMDPAYSNPQAEKELNPFFLEYGFRFSSLESAYFGEITGVKSDLYIPVGLWNRLLYPFINKSMWREAYCDKNMFHRFLNIKEAQKEIDILEPCTIACCCSGRYFIGCEDRATRDETINAIVSYGKDVIVKPTVHTSHGAGIIKVKAEELTETYLNEIVTRYYPDFTVQEVIKQHPNLAAYNPTSVNTIRITTYQDFDGNVKVLYASQRFGGKGKVYDNADDPKGDGGFCAIGKDGIVNRTIHHYRSMQTTQLDDSVLGITPQWDKVVEAVLYLHTRFPQFALIGWDMTVTEDGHPLVIEYNFAPGLGTGQLAHGPIFSEQDLRDIMERIQYFDINKSSLFMATFKDRPSNSFLRFS